LILLFLIIELSLSKQSPILSGVYGRYLDSDWSLSIINQGHFSGQQFPADQGLLNNANGYSFNLLPSMVIVTLHFITGVNILELQNLPIIAISFMFSIIYLAFVLYRHKYLSSIYLLLVVLLYGFFSGGIIAQAASINRIIIAYSALFFLIGVFLQAEGKNSSSYWFVFLFVLVNFTLAYSTIAVVMLPFIVVLSIVTAIRTKQYMYFNIAITSSIFIIAYYFFFTHFLNTAVILADQTINSQNITFHIFEPSSNYWPAAMQYVYPSRSLITWFIVAYSTVVIFILSLFTVIARLLKYLKTRNLSKLDDVLIAIVITVFVVAIGSTLGVITTALDMRTLLGIFGPMISIYAVMKLYSLITSKRLYYVLISIIIFLGIFLNIYNVEYQSQIPPVNVVTESDIVSSKWIADFGNGNKKISSDLNYLSTYLTINVPTPMTYIPSGIENIEMVFYEANIQLLENQNVGYFVITQQMKYRSIFPSEGAPLKPNPDLETELSMNNSINKIYSNNDSVYMLP